MKKEKTTNNKESAGCVGVLPAARQTLYHMLMCVKLYEGLDEVTRAMVAKWRKHFQYLIAIKFHLKETKRRKERKASPSDTY